MRYKPSKYSAYLERGSVSFQVRELCESICKSFFGSNEFYFNICNYAEELVIVCISFK